MRRLRAPPYLQIALDEPNLDAAKKVISRLPENGKILLEAGTPLIRRYGTRVLNELRATAGNRFLVADLKTLDAGKFEADLAQEGTADAAVASGLAHRKTLDAFIGEAKTIGMYAAVDMLNVEDPVNKLKVLDAFPDIVILHRGIDQECGRVLGLELVPAIHNEFPNEDFLVAMAGGVTPETAGEALWRGADIIVVGRFVTQAADVKAAVRLFLVMPAFKKRQRSRF